MKAVFTFCFILISAFAQEQQDSNATNVNSLPLLQQELQKANQESQKVFPFEIGKTPLENVSIFQYAGIILVLLGLIAFLWYVKNRLNAPQSKESFNPLHKLFSKNANLDIVQVQSITTFGINNKLIIFEAYKKRYLVVVSQNNIALIDSYQIDTFKDMLEQDNAES